MPTVEQLKTLREIQDSFNETVKQLEQDEEQYWNSLTKEQQLLAFCAVVRRIHRGELEKQGSYRYVLYTVFGFGPEAYMPAQMAGYLALHNSVHGPDYDRKLLEAFANYLVLPKDQIQQKISEFLC